MHKINHQRLRRALLQGMGFSFAAAALVLGDADVVGACVCLALLPGCWGNACLH